MTIEVRQAALEDFEAIACFIGEAYGPIAPFKGRERWNWQFVVNPFRAGGDRVPVWVAERERQVVGQIAVQPACLQIDGVEHAAGWAVDFMVLPGFRGHALGHRLHAEAASQTPLMTILTMAPATRRIAERAGCVTLGPVYEFIKPVRLTAANVRRYCMYRTTYRPFFRKAARVACDGLQAHRLAAAFANPCIRLLDRSAAGRKPRSNVDVIEVTRFDSELDEFWQRVRHAYPAIFVRDARFLNWRFFGTPDLHYRCFVARRSGACSGYMVLRRATAAELPFGIIVDLLAAPDDSATIEGLIAAAIARFGHDVEAISCATSMPAIKRHLRRTGFLATRTHHPIVVCHDPSLRRRIEELADRWYFTKADHDWDQIYPA